MTDFNHTEKIKNDLLQRIHSYRETQLIYIAARLDISDHLKDGAKTVGELAALTGANRDSLFRVMRALAAIGIYEETGDKFQLNDYGCLLAADDPDSIKSVAQMRGGEVNWKPWGELLYAVKTGCSAFEKAFGMNLFDYYERNPEAGQAFNEGMRVFTRNDVKLILENYDFSGFKKIIDVGGGSGALLISILEKNREQTGILFDLPRPVEQARQFLKEADIENRLRVEYGDMFESVPMRGDCYILKKILHDWDDEKCIGILKNCRASISDNGRLLVIEMMIREGEKPARINDVHMMVVCPGGKERTLAEFESLFGKSGFKLSAQIAASESVVILECIPV